MLVDFLCASAGGALHYTGRDMKSSHRGMGIDEDDWRAFIGHVEATLDKFAVPPRERAEVLAFVASTKPDIVEALRKRGIDFVRFIGGVKHTGG